MKNIYLIGYMGSGKSTIGQILSQELGRDFLDLDQIIIDRAGYSIPEIFRIFGEDTFRDLEASALQSTFALVDKIIATGGGAPCFFDNMSVMKEHGIVIYLKGSVDVIIDRLKNDEVVRPILRRNSDNDLNQFITDHLQTRSPYYEKAIYSVSIEKSKKEVVTEIINLLSPH